MKTIISIILGGILLSAISILFCGAILMLAWNYIIPSLFHLMRLTLFQAIALTTVVYCLFATFRTTLTTKS
jgi:hypothetical protein